LYKRLDDSDRPPVLLASCKSLSSADAVLLVHGWIMLNVPEMPHAQAEGLYIMMVWISANSAVHCTVHCFGRARSWGLCQWRASLLVCAWELPV